MTDQVRTVVARSPLRSSAAIVSSKIHARAGPAVCQQEVQRTRFPLSGRRSRRRSSSVRTGARVDPTPVPRRRKPSRPLVRARPDHLVQHHRPAARPRLVEDVCAELIAERVDLEGVAAELADRKRGGFLPDDACRGEQAHRSPQIPGRGGEFREQRQARRDAVTVIGLALYRERLAQAAHGLRAVARPLRHQPQVRKRARGIPGPRTRCGDRGVPGRPGRRSNRPLTQATNALRARV